MKEEDKELLIYISDMQISVLREVLEKIYSGIWSDIFDQHYTESRDRIIFDLEEYVLKPERHLTPISRIFKDEDAPVRQEIKGLVTELFHAFEIFIKEKNFKANQN